MAMASAKAKPRMKLVKSAPWASGLRPSASMALLTSMPIPGRGPSEPRPIARAAASSFKPSSVIDAVLLSLYWAGFWGLTMGRLRFVALLAMGGDGDSGENEGQ